MELIINYALKEIISSNSSNVVFSEYGEPEQRDIFISDCFEVIVINGNQVIFESENIYEDFKNNIQKPINSVVNYQNDFTNKQYSRIIIGSSTHRCYISFWDPKLLHFQGKYIYTADLCRHDGVKIPDYVISNITYLGRSIVDLYQRQKINLWSKKIYAKSSQNNWDLIHEGI